MTRDYSQFLPPGDRARTQPGTPPMLATLGWQPFFARQIDAGEASDKPPVRIVEVHRNSFHVLGDDIDLAIPPAANTTVGDWLLLDRSNPAASPVLQRKSLFKRRAPGTDRKVQLIAANIDTVFVVTSCNQDFNVARLERYIALGFEAEVVPVIVLTKADLCDDPDRYSDAARAISGRVPVLVLDARGPQARSKLAPWCTPGQTLAFLGSSGVGKSTLVNALMQAQTVATQAIREDDSKGRHTTTSRQLHLVQGGFTVLDTPGMRELQLTDVGAGLASVFPDLDALASDCRFRDCRHEIEPGCAILAALDRGEIDGARLARWKKLVAEERYNSSTLAERRSSDRLLGKTIRAFKKSNSK